MPFFSDDYQYTKYGFFEVGNIKTFSKYEAWQIAIQNGIATENIKFNFNDNEMSRYDWTVEPTTSLSDLYKQRAQQLREKYDYIVLFYSGGIDSHVILNTFYKNNIKIDEIIICGNKTYQGDNSKLNQEIFGKAIPYIDTLDLTKFNTKVTYKDIGELIVNQFDDPFHFENFMYYFNGPFPPWYMAYKSPMFKLQNQSHIDISDQGKKICYMWGYDKPNMFNIDGKWNFKFTDSVSDFAVRPFFYHKLLDVPLTNFYDEPFFVTPDLPELTIKQCHVVAKTLNSIKSYKDVRLGAVENIANTGPFIEHPIGVEFPGGSWLKKKELERVVYPEENVDTFRNDKVGGSIMLSLKDKWFFRSISEGRNKLIKKYKILLREHHDYFKYNVDDIPISSITFYSKPYVIDKE
jgi:hypothetical protein